MWTEKGEKGDRPLFPLSSAGKRGLSPFCSEKGSALLLVLWLSAALAAIAFSLAGTVRTETERASNTLDGVKAYYLATGAIERALLYMQWGPAYQQPGGVSRYYSPWMTVLPFSFPTGEAVVEILPESSKLSLNASSPEVLYRLFLALGPSPERSREIVEAIMDWRMPAPGGAPTLFDQFYLSQAPSFLARHASFQEVEELLLVKGMTPELFHGGFGRDPSGRLVPLTGARDCLSVYSSGNAIDVNTAPPAVLQAAGLPPDLVERVVRTRAEQPFRTPQEVQVIQNAAGPIGARLRIGGNSIFTLRASARLRLDGGKLSDLRRAVSATVKIGATATGHPYEVLRWQDRAWAQ